MSKHGIQWIWVGIIVLLLTGCSDSNSQVKGTPPSSSEAPLQVDKEKVTSASRESVNGNPEAAPKTKAEPAQPSANGSSGTSVHQNEQPHGDPDTIRLLGVALGEARIKVIERLGQADWIYETEDENVTQIHEYSGFSIGYSIHGKVSWISVISADIDPLLNGIRVGSTKDSLVTSWGKPDQANDYQLRYQKKNAALKLDIDPATQTIQSISLYER